VSILPLKKAKNWPIKPAIFDSFLRLKNAGKLLVIIAPNNHSKKLAFATNFYSFLKRLIVDLFKLIKYYFYLIDLLIQITLSVASLYLIHFFTMCNSNDGNQKNVIFL